MRLAMHRLLVALLLFSPPALAAGRWTVSTSVFHSPQSGHLPIHLAWALPQFWQT